MCKFEKCFEFSVSLEIGETFEEKCVPNVKEEVFCKRARLSSDRQSGYSMLRLYKSTHFGEDKARDTSAQTSRCVREDHLL